MNMPPVENRIFVLILQHPQETKEPLATAKMVCASLANASLRVGLSWANLRQAAGRSADPRRWAVLHLGPTHAPVQGLAQEIVALDRRGEPLRDQNAALAAIEGLVVLDGSWKEAKSLWWRNPWLLKLQRIVLHPRQASAYHRLRREPRRQALSTLEAVALALKHLDPTSRAEPALLGRLDALIADAASQPRDRR